MRNVHESSPSTMAGEAKGEDMKERRYCICGASMEFSISGRAAERGKGVIEQTWARLHYGPGHEPTDAKVAYRARIKAEKKETAGYYDGNRPHDG